MAERFSGVYDYEGYPRVDHEGHIYYNPDVLREEYDFDRVPESERLDVVVSGGSMGGLFTAHALQQSGHRVNVYERTTKGEMKGRGAGILSDPEMLLYMERHGLTDDRSEVTVPISRLDYLDRDGSVRVSRPYRIWSTSWDTFYRPLRDAVGLDSYHMDSEVVDVDAGDEAVTAHLADGRTATGDLLVAAEGYGSRTRQQFLPDVELEYAGYVCWRGLVPESRLPPEVADHLDETFVIFHGHDFQFLTYPVPGAGGETAKGERRVNLSWYENVPKGAELDRLLLDVDGVQREGSLPPGKLRSEIREEQLRKAEEQLPVPFVEYMHALEDMYIQNIYDLKVPRMVFDRVCLLGDSAFFARPHIASGTAKAAANGFELAEALCSGAPLRDSLSSWETSQLELGNRLVDLARERGDRYVYRR